MQDDDTRPIPRVPREGTRRTRPPGQADRGGHAARTPAQRPTRTPPKKPLPAKETGHGHFHGPAAPASRQVRTLLIALLAPLALASVIGAVLLYPFGAPEVTTAGGTQTPVRGVVTVTQASGCSSGEATEAQPGDECLAVGVQMSDGPAAGTEIRTLLPVEPSTPRFAVGDKVVLSYAGGEPLDGESYRLVDFQRDTPLVLLAVLFAVAVLVLGRWQGVAALGALALSFVVLLLFVLPAIIAGEQPAAGGGRRRRADHVHRCCT